MTSLPTGWARTFLGDPFSWGSGGTPSRAREVYYGGNIPWVVIGDLNDGLVTETSESITMAGMAASSAKWVEKGAVLLAMYGSIGKLGIAGRRLTTNQAIAFTQCPQGISNRYLFYYLMSRRSMLLGEGKGGTQSNISQTVIKAFPFVCAPTKEQQRIVDAIDSYLTRLDDAIAGLEGVLAKLKAYRASVLKAAVEGRLVPTEASLARAERRDYEPADVLLARILKERRRRWEEVELARLTAAGKTPKGNKWKVRYQEPIAPDTSKLSELPEGWCWATVDMVGSMKGGLTKGQKRHPKEFLRDVPYLRVANVQRGYLDLKEIKTIRATPDEVKDLRLEVGDVLFNEGGDRDKLGRGWIWGGEIENCIHQNHVFRVRIFTSDLQPRLLSWYGNSSGQRYFFDEGKQTTNLASINMTKLKLLPVPIPPRCEQARIMDEVERMLSVADEVSISVAHDIRRCIRLRQAVLKCAFEGKLVDQDPTDEPAEELLARIRAGRGAVSLPKNTRARKARGAA